MLVILLGKTSAGKNLIAQKLEDEHNFQRVVTYTTRPKRDGEKDHVDYHFISEEEFLNKIATGDFFEYKTYTVADGSVWYYGSPIISEEDIINNNKLLILTPDGYRDFLRSEIPHKSFYIYANNTTVKRRLVKRGDDPKEAERRILHDNQDFKGVENLVHKIVYNNWDTSIDSVVNTILDYLD